MKKLLVPFMVVAMVLSGCSLLESGPTAEDIMGEAFANLEGMDYYSYEFSFDGEMIAEDEAVAFSIEYTGQQDNTDVAKPKFTMDVDMEISMEEFENQSMTGALRSDGDYLYFILNEVSDFDGELPSELVDSFRGQWYSLSLEDETLGSFLSPFTTFSMEDDEDMTDEQKELIELYADTDFFTDVEFLKTEDGYDVYTGTLDTEASKKFMTKVLEIQGMTLTDLEEEGFDDFMDSIALDIMVSIDQADNALAKVTGAMVVTDVENVDGVSIAGEFDFSMEFMNFHEPVVIEAPEGVEEFDPMMIFAAMLGIDPAMLEEMEMAGDGAEFGY